MSLLFILFKTLDYFQQFLQERLAHKALGLLQVAHSSERVRERDEQCAQVARIYTGTPVYHPDPGPIANVQVWEQRASEFWRFVACFFVTIHFSDAPVTLRRSPFQK